MKIKDKIYPDGSDTRKPEKIASTSNRLQEIMLIRRIKQADLARATDISRGAISNYVLGRYEPKSDIIQKLANALKCSEMWLWGYDVPMEKQAQFYVDEENPYALDVGDTMHTLEADDQKYVRDWVKEFAKNPEEMKISPHELQLTEGEKEILELFNRVPDDQQKLVLGMIRAALCTDK